MPLAFYFLIYLELLYSYGGNYDRKKESISRPAIFQKI